jgi:hypothetical protein
MNDYNRKRKTLRIELAQKKITWRQFVDELEMLIIKFLVYEKDFWDETSSNEKEMATSICKTQLA